TIDMTATFEGLRRKATTLAAIVTALVTAGAVALPGLASADQVQTRSINISNSTPSATGVKYKVTFTTGAAGTAKGIVVDFCGDTPIIGAACDTTSSATTGLPSFTAASATLGAVTNMTGWTISSKTATTVKLTSSTALAANTAVSFELSNITNMNVARSFYARVYTYSSATPDYVSPTSVGTKLDYGGFALSTANNIAVSATVMETLTFCTSGLVSAAAPTDCSAPTTPTVVLGNGTPQTIDANAVYDNSAGTSRSYMVISTNALSGAAVSMKSNWSCNGLSSDNGATCGIPGAPGSITAGAAGFGVKVAAGTGTTGSLVPTNSYSAGTFHMGPTGTATTYGDTIANTATAPCSNMVSQLTFGATASLTTPAGIYSVNETLIATGTF
ncbi:MAG TPA: hypothetical protein VFL85_02290, partial [Candidatus Saccharimonadales bacterium]|nr:hypothetical protein [Candidatus Saccharimonadales bacterium]